MLGCESVAKGKLFDKNESLKISWDYLFKKIKSVRSTKKKGEKKCSKNKERVKDLPGRIKIITQL
jgi:hypothetical protein